MKPFSYVLDKFHKLNLSKEVKPVVIGSVITGIFGILIALIYIFGGKNSPEAKAISISDYATNNGQVMLGNFNFTQGENTATKKLLDEWDKRLDKTEKTVEFSKKDIDLLKKALQDLDNRTSGFEKLPDGRIKVGNLSTGTPTVVIEEQKASAQAFAKGNYKEALEHSRKAIEAHEAAKAIPVGMAVGGQLLPNDEAKIYRLATMAAQNIKSNEEAVKYAEKAASLDAIPIHKGLLAGAYYNSGRIAEAKSLIEQVIKEDPDNETWKNFKSAMTQGAKAIVPIN